MNIDVFDIDSGGKSLERIVVKSMQRSQQPQVFRDPLRQRLSQGVILNGEGDVVAQYFKRIKRVFFVGASPSRRPNAITPTSFPGLSAGKCT